MVVLIFSKRCNNLSRARETPSLTKSRIFTRPLVELVQPNGIEPPASLTKPRKKKPKEKEREKKKPLSSIHRFLPLHPTKEISINPRINMAQGAPHGAIPRAPRKGFNPKQKITEHQLDYYKLRLEMAVKREMANHQPEDVDTVITSKWARELYKEEQRKNRDEKYLIKQYGIIRARAILGKQEIDDDPPLHGPPGSRIKHLQLPTPLDPLSVSIKRAIVQYPYFVERTQNKQLPVYTDIRCGRTRLLTIIRRIEGDVTALANDLRKDLFPKSKKEIVSVRSVSNQVVVKGLHDYEIKYWLYKKGF